MSTHFQPAAVRAADGTTWVARPTTDQGAVFLDSLGELTEGRVIVDYDRPMLDSYSPDANISVEDLARMVLAGEGVADSFLANRAGRTTLEELDEIRSLAVGTIAEDVRAWNANVSAQVQAAADLYEQQVYERDRAEAQRRLDFTIEGLMQDAANVGVQAEFAREKIYNAIGDIADSQQFAAEALARTLEGMEVQQAGTFRDFSLGTQASRTQLNRLTGVGSPIADLTQTVREEERKEQEALEDLAERNAKAAEKRQQQQYSRRLNDYQTNLRALETDQSRAFAEAVRQANEYRRREQYGFDSEDAQRQFQADRDRAISQYRSLDSALNQSYGMNPIFEPTPEPAIGDTTFDPALWSWQ